MTRERVSAVVAGMVGMRGDLGLEVVLSRSSWQKCMLTFKKAALAQGLDPLVASEPQNAVSRARSFSKLVLAEQNPVCKNGWIRGDEGYRKPSIIYF